jgi:hypothetical protein
VDSKDETRKDTRALVIRNGEQSANLHLHQSASTKFFDHTIFWQSTAAQAIFLPSHPKSSKYPESSIFFLPSTSVIEGNC